MDMETENVMKILFNNNIRDEWKENPDFALYLSKLGSFTAEQLAKEPAKLNEEKAAVLEQTQDLAFTNYKTFIQTAECTREICKQFNNVEEHLTSLIEKLPELTQKCQEFAQTTTDINSHRRLNSLTLTRNAQLLEFLEMPQLMDTCIREAHFDEALNLVGYVRRLGKKHGNIPVIATIVRDIESSWLVMLHELLDQLRSDLQLPNCLQVVGFLRRMEFFSEAELRLKFLQCRDSWLQKLLSAIPKTDANHHISKTIELSRIHLFNIVTEYRAIFSDDDPILPTSRDNNINESAIFYSWLTEKISQFLNTLEDDLSEGIGSSLDSIIGQCMYFGLSFSRIGADFRGLLVPIFVRGVSRNCENLIQKASKKLKEDMDQFALTRTQTVRTASSQNTKPEQPPQTLLEFYPLAEYCNGLLVAFNELRLCTPIAVAENVTNHLQESLTSVSKCLLSFYNEQHPAISKADQNHFLRLCISFSEELLPYIQKCLHMVFPMSALASHLGVPVQQLQKGGITNLDFEKVLEPIRDILPVKVVPTVPLVSPQQAEEVPQSADDKKVSPTMSESAQIESEILDAVSATVEQSSQPTTEPQEVKTTVNDVPGEDNSLL